MIYQKTGLYRNSGYQETEYRPKPSRNYSKIFDIIIFLLVVAAITYVLFFTSVFTINRVKIYGLEQINKPTFARAIKKQALGKNLLLLNTSKIRKQIFDRYTQISEVYVNKDLPSVLVVNVQERHLAFTWSTGNQYYSVDENGIVYEKTNKEIGTKVEINNSNLSRPKLGKKYFQYQETKFIEKLNKSFSRETKLDVQKIILDRSLFEILVQTPKFTIIFNDTRSYQEQFNALEKILPQVKNDISQYIDVRVPGKIFYK